MIEVYDCSYRWPQGSPCESGQKNREAFGLSGCVEDRLADCLATTDEIFVLRQTILQGQIRENFNTCLSRNPVVTCRQIFLYASPVIVACMNRSGYTADIPDERCQTCDQTACYKPNWMAVARSLLFIKRNSN